MIWLGHLPLNPHPFIISFLATCPALCVAHWSVIAYPSILENKMLTKPHNCCCKLSSWSSRQNNNICQNWLLPSSTKPVGRAGRSIGFGRVSEGVRTEGAVNTGLGQFQENWKGVHMKLWVRVRHMAGAALPASTWLRKSQRGTVGCRSGLADTSYLVALRPSLTWPWHVVTQ